MSTQFNEAMVEIINMPYYKNQHHQSGSVNFGHEDAIKEVLIKHNFVEYQLRKVKKSILKEWAETSNDSDLRKALFYLKPGQFIVQPGGSQNFPDILVYDYSDRFISLECKSGKSACPTWNDNIPKPNSIYIFSSLKYNATTAFLGKDVISEKERQAFIQQREEFKKINDMYKKMLSKLDKFNRGWALTARPKYSQYGGGNKVDYFTHPSRQLCETNVLKFSLL